MRTAVKHYKWRPGHINVMQARCDAHSNGHDAVKIAAKTKRRVVLPSLSGNHLIRGLFACRLTARRSIERCQGAVNKHWRE
jgi:hypothetical protein